MPARSYEAEPLMSDVNVEYYERLQQGRDDYWRYMAAPRRRVGRPAPRSSPHSRTPALPPHEILDTRAAPTYSFAHASFLAA